MIIGLRPKTRINKQSSRIPQVERDPNLKLYNSQRGENWIHCARLSPGRRSRKCGPQKEWNAIYHSSCLQPTIQPPLQLNHTRIHPANWIIPHILATRIHNTQQVANSSPLHFPSSSGITVIVPIRQIKCLIKIQLLNGRTVFVIRKRILHFYISILHSRYKLNDLLTYGNTFIHRPRRTLIQLWIISIDWMFQNREKEIKKGEVVRVQNNNRTRFWHLLHARKVPGQNHTIWIKCWDL